MAKEKFKLEASQYYWYINTDLESAGLPWPGPEQGEPPVNCFKTRREASRYAQLFRHLIHTLNEDTLVNMLKDVRELTTEVFNWPECPAWAEYAAVDEDGNAAWFSAKPTTIMASDDGEDEDCHLLGYWGSDEYNGKWLAIPGVWYSLEWDKSLLTRPAAVPDWCRAGSLVFYAANGLYATVESVKRSGIKLRFDNNGSDVIPIDDFSNLRPAQYGVYTPEEMESLVGKVITGSSGSYLCTAYYKENGCVVFNDCVYSAQELSDLGFSCNGKPCKVLEHFEGTEWVR